MIERRNSTNNGEIMCVVEILVTNKNPDVGEVYSLTLLPLVNTFEPSKILLPLSLRWVPDNPASFKMPRPNIRSAPIVRLGKEFHEEINDLGMKRSVALNRFDTWFKIVKQKGVSRLRPIFFNAGVELPFLIKLFKVGNNGMPFYYDYFSFSHVCLTGVFSYLNDYIWYRSGNPVFRTRGAGMDGVCNKLDIIRETKVNRYGGVIDRLKIYKELVESDFIERSIE